MKDELRKHSAREMLDWILSVDPSWDNYMKIPVLVWDFEYGKQTCSCLAMILDFYRHLIFLEGGLKDIYDEIPEKRCPWEFTVQFYGAGVIITREARTDDSDGV